MAYQGLGRDGGRSGWSWMPVGGAPYRSARFPLAGLWDDISRFVSGGMSRSEEQQYWQQFSTALPAAAVAAGAPPKEVAAIRAQARLPAQVMQAENITVPEPDETASAGSGLGLQTAIMFLGAGAIGYLIRRKKYNV